MAALSPPLAAMVSLATNSTATASPIGIPIWYGIGALGLTVVGFLVWFFLLRKQKD